MLPILLGLRRAHSWSKVIALIWFALALVVRAALAWPQMQPGYMDSAYYYDIADNLARGRGLTENFIWNYLAHPTSLPQPSNAYWMPLTSFVVAPFLWLFGTTYRTAQIPMVLLSALLVPLTYALSLRLFARRDWAIVSALLMLASGFYLPYWSATDGFAIFALIGTTIFLLIASSVQRPISQSPNLPISLVLGLLIALAHLTRADGFLLSASYFPLWWNSNRNTKPLFAVLSGYLLVMLPWFARNVLAFGAPLVGGGALFMRTYDDLFSYETPLTFDYWLAGGADHIAATMLRALTLNVATLAGALCFIWFPFVLIALWRERMRVVVQSAVVYLLVLLFVASFVLSLPGPRGLFLHSLSASLPLLYALAPVGLSAVVAWIARRRAAWNATQAERIFGAAFVVMALLMSTYFYAVNIIGSKAQPPWNQRFVVYRPVDEFLRREMRDALSPVMVINPPAFTYFNQRAALAIPSDDPLALVRAAEQFGAHYVVVESDHPRHLDMLYDFSVTDQRFQLRATFTDATGAQVQLYQIVPLR